MSTYRHFTVKGAQSGVLHQFAVEPDRELNPFRGRHATLCGREMEAINVYVPADVERAPQRHCQRCSSHPAWSTQPMEVST